MNDQSKSVTAVEMVGRVKTRVKKIAPPKIVPKPDDIRLDATELRMILAYRRMLPRYQNEVSRIVDGLTELPQALRFIAPVLHLVNAGGAL